MGPRCTRSAEPNTRQALLLSTRGRGPWNSAPFAIFTITRAKPLWLLRDGRGSCRRRAGPETRGRNRLALAAGMGIPKGTDRVNRTRAEVNLGGVLACCGI